MAHALSPCYAHSNDCAGYADTMPDVSYPPGVLTGRPLEMFEAHNTLDLYGVPEQWFSSGNRGGIDVEMLQELCDALDHRHDEEMQWIENQLQHLERYQDETAYYMYPMLHEGGGVKSVSWSFGVQDALCQFEEDFEFEQWLKDKDHINAIKDFNRHILLSCEDFHDRDGWAGEISSEKGWTADFSVDVGEYLLTERYTMNVEIVNHSPGYGGYAKGTTEYGDVYIPYKFTKYLPPIVGISTMTLVPQIFNFKSKCIPWKCIFQHGGVYH